MTQTRQHFFSTVRNGELVAKDQLDYQETWSSARKPGASVNVDVSIVIPLLNEAKNVELLYEQLKLVLDGLDRGGEVILVDDGSTDASFPIMIKLQAQDERLRVIRLRRNFGQTAAFSMLVVT